ncbi:type II toxin-antitoxin system RelE/ParE family toxin [Chelatococcus reniformis]|uniref:Addiction module antitoxin RelB n=1 Tax=Chelatococcus reniformis TaxID=1494448 RepID=A0A916XNM9_9HYPH|nr:type II toxin-antitoxin system RelE/ParE family toxin [Chelatococcus reniformis]GGC90295.1 addiction module antitoxin RelB [Chelatococcus reniformis]
MLKQTETFSKWLKKLNDSKASAAIAARLLRLQSGLTGDAKPVGSGVSELRIHYGPGYRIYFRRRGAQIIILLCGGTKSTQQADIAQAIKLAKEWKDDDDG